MRRNVPGEKEWVKEKYPLARCERFPQVQPSPLFTKWRVRLAPNGEIFSRGNTAAQAWRRAYEKCLSKGLL